MYLSAMENVQMVNKHIKTSRTSHGIIHDNIWIIERPGRIAFSYTRVCNRPT